MDRSIALRSSLPRRLVLAVGASFVCAPLFLVTAFFAFAPDKSREADPLTAFFFMLAFVFALLFWLWFARYQKGLVLSEEEVVVEFFGWRKSHTHRWSGLQRWGEAQGLFILEFDSGQPYYIDAAIFQPGDRARLKDFLTARFFGSQVAVVYHS